MQPSPRAEVTIDDALQKAVGEFGLGQRYVFALVRSKHSHASKSERYANLSLAPWTVQSIKAALDWCRLKMMSIARSMAFQ
jgi:hypothetical protein